MPKSDYARNLDVIQSSAHAHLKIAGFKKKGRTHNYRCASGLIHVVNFQMGEYPVGEHYVIPGIRESFYGRFVVNLGVLLPCVYEVEWQKPVGDFAQEHYCTIRQRLGTLAFGRDTWFEIPRDPSTLASTIVELMKQFGLPWFERFTSYENVLGYYQAHGDLPFQNHGRATLEAAIVAHQIGNAAYSRELFNQAHNTEESDNRSAQPGNWRNKPESPGK